MSSDIKTYVVRILLDQYGRDSRTVERRVFAKDEATAAAIAGAHCGDPRAIDNATVKDVTDE